MTIEQAARSVGRTATPTPSAADRTAPVTAGPPRARTRRPSAPRVRPRRADRRSATEGEGVMAIGSTASASRTAPRPARSPRRQPCASVKLQALEGALTGPPERQLPAPAEGPCQVGPMTGRSVQCRCGTRNQARFTKPRIVRADPSGIVTESASSPHLAQHASGIGQEWWGDRAACTGRRAGVRAGVREVKSSCVELAGNSPVEKPTDGQCSLRGVASSSPGSVVQ